jgi:hypothetical protein
MQLQTLGKLFCAGGPPQLVQQGEQPGAGGLGQRVVELPWNIIARQVLHRAHVENQPCR